MQSTTAVSTSGLPNKEPIILIERPSIDFDTRIIHCPTTSVAMDFKSQMVANDVVIACLEEEV
jgi:hypothetical protein